MTRRQKQRPDKKADVKARGLLKIRNFHRRANLLVIPYSPEEQREQLTAFQDEFNEDGCLAADSYMHLNIMTHGDADRVLDLWGMMNELEVDMNGVDNHPDYQPEEPITDE